ncbi:MAG: class I SAM-dependent methyltransferase [Thermoflexales bacterium]|nr:class I SAM-dependent methyltransferase [Thermoflexales bacterium]
MTETQALIDQILKAAMRRSSVIDARHEGAFRLFAGFYEGEPRLLLDVYATTMVVHDYSAREAPLPIDAIVDAVLSTFPWLTAALLKRRDAPGASARNGVLIRGSRSATRIREDGVRYAVNLCLNQDCSFYLDTRVLRGWARASLNGKRVLNTFAYTGSLGVAAAAGGARVLHIDLNPLFLNVAKDSYALNGLPVQRADFWPGDFFPALTRLNRQGERFDSVLLDPPFFARTGAGTVDTENALPRLINKCRPLVADGGTLVVVNNAVFVSGQTFLTELGGLCADGYLTIERTLDVPADVAGYPETRIGQPPADPSPFNHSTKIVVMRVRRKSA